jgi:hypothetical protein
LPEEKKKHLRVYAELLSGRKKWINALALK